MKRMKVYYVDFDKLWKPGTDDEKIPPVRSASVMVNAESISEAINIAWKSVTFDQNEYEIVAVNRPEGRRCTPRGEF